MSKTIPERHTGDTFKVPVTLYSDGVAIDVSGASGISASLVTTDDANVAVLIASTAQANTGGADWANGIVMAKFSDAQMATVTTYGLAYIEIQVTSGGEVETWPRQPVLIKKGTIA